MNEKTQYKFKLLNGEEITGILIGETNDEWVIKIKNGDTNTVPKKNVIDCDVVYTRIPSGWEVMYDTLQNMLDHGM